MTRWGLALVALVMMAGNADAQVRSFRCSEAVTPTLVTICNTPDLVGQDNTMQGVYDLAAERSDQKTRLKLAAEQLVFLRQRSECGTDKKCLHELYVTRITYILFNY